MISWFNKFRTSPVHAETKQLPRSRRDDAIRVEEFSRLDENRLPLDQVLRRTVRRPEMPSDLHNSIMGAVRSAAATKSLQRPALVPLVRWLSVPAAAAVALLGSWLLWRGPLHPGRISASGQVATLNQAAALLEAGDQMKREMPAAMMAPLSNEWTRIQRDVDSTEQFLVASVPFGDLASQ
jgi:hypothetical protein